MAPPLSATDFGPYEPSREEAREELARELADPVYADARPNPLLQFLSDLWDAFVAWLESLEAIQPNLGSLVVLLVLAALVAAVVLLVRPRLRRRQAPAEATVGLVATRSSEDYRRRAAAAAVVHDWSTACLERFRALVRQAEERTLLDPQPGRTAFEVSGRLEAVFPAEARHLHAAATLFNAVHYGNHEASAEDWRTIDVLETRLAAAAPATSTPAPELAVPR